MELRLHGRAPYSSISKGKIGVKTVDVLACVVPSYSALVAADGRTTVPARRWSTVGDPVEVMRLIRLLGGRLGAVRQRKVY